MNLLILSKNQKGIAHIGIILVLLVSIVLATALVQKKTNLTPHAQEEEDQPETEENCQGDWRDGRCYTSACSGPDCGGNIDAEAECIQSGKKWVDGQCQDEEAGQPPTSTCQPTDYCDNKNRVFKTCDGDIERFSPVPDPTCDKSNGQTPPDPDPQSPQNPTPQGGSNVEDDGSFMGSVTRGVERILDGAIDTLAGIADSLGLTAPDDDHLKQIGEAEAKRSLIEQQIRRQLDVNNGTDSRKKLLEDLYLNEDADNKAIAQALNTRLPNGVTISDDLTVSVDTKDRRLALAPDAMALDLGTVLALGIGIDCPPGTVLIGPVFNTTSLKCGDSPITLPGVTNPTQLPPCPTRGTFVPGTCRVVPPEELPFCPKIGDTATPCKPIPETLPPCSKFGGLQQACIVEDEKKPACALGGFQNECDASSLPLCSKLGVAMSEKPCIFDPNSTGLPDPIPPSDITGSGTGRTGPPDPQTPVVVTSPDSEADRLQQDKEEARIRNEAAIEEKQKQIRELQDKINETRKNLLDSNMSEETRAWLENEIRLEQIKIDGYNQEIADAKLNTGIAEARYLDYLVENDPDVRKKTQEAAEKSDEYFRAHSDVTEAASNIIEWAKNNVKGYSTKGFNFELDNYLKVGEQIKLILGQSDYSPEFRRLIAVYELAKELDKKAKDEYVAAQNDLSQFRDQKLGEIKSSGR